MNMFIVRGSQMIPVKQIKIDTETERYVFNDMVHFGFGATRSNPPMQKYDIFTLYIDQKKNLFYLGIWLGINYAMLEVNAKRPVNYKIMARYARRFHVQIIENYERFQREMQAAEEVAAKKQAEEAEIFWAAQPLIEPEPYWCSMCNDWHMTWICPNCQKEHDCLSIYTGATCSECDHSYRLDIDPDMY